MADQIYRMLTGDVTDLPPKESNIVRIFTSSTFTDTFEERNKLMKDVYPNLRTYCQQHSLEFQVVDMRWGVRDEASADHKTSELCIEEIKTCKRLTPGPNYVCFLGDKYGYRPFPAKIPATEFELFLEISQSCEDISTSDMDLLTEWFVKDDNAIPAEYVLQPVTTKLHYFTDMREEVREQNKKERAQWWSIFETFQRVLRQAARIAGSQGKLSAKDVHKYFKSVTEDEIEHGILNAADPESQTLCYFRHIEDIHVNIGEQKTPLYTDIIQGKQDIEAQEHLDRLKRQRILNKLGESNITHYTVPWTSEGINVADRCHQEYLNTFCDKFESDIHRLIDKSLNVMKLNKVDQNPLYKEILHHSWFCRDKCASFKGRQDILERAKYFLCDDKRLKPLVIYGASGSGKTSIMAMIVSQVKDWLGKSSVCVFRFLGTSPDTSNIVAAITSISRQIHEVYDLGPLKEEISEDYSQLVRHFHELLTSPEISSDKPLVLVVDSIDQLSPSFNAHLMNWLPKSCSPNVKIVLSVLPGYYDILPTLRRSLRDEECYIEVPSLSRETGQEILDAWLHGIGRTLNEHQRRIVMSSFDKCPQPLFLKLIFTEASQWSSYTDVSGVSLGASVKEAIGLLFDRLERKHGRVLVAHALGYMTAARNGLTENELEDILSLDDDVIDDVYQYWDPPVEGVVRLPNLLWARVRHDVNEFLVERQADKKTIVTWYHRQFWESAELRYLGDKKEKITRHALMCDYFRASRSIPSAYIKVREEYHARFYATGPYILGNLWFTNLRPTAETHKGLEAYNIATMLRGVDTIFGRTWGGRRKKPIVLTRRKKALPDADRQVSSQPLLFAKDVYNIRKLSELPYHLIRAERFEDLDDEVLFNFEWINAKIKGQSLSDVLLDYENAICVSEDMDMRLVQETLVLSSSNIKHDNECLAPQLIARLLAFKEQFPKIAMLIEQAYRWCYAKVSPLLIPMSACLISAGGPLITNLRGHTKRVNAVAITRDNNFLVTSGEDSLINIWNTNNHDCLHTLKIPGKGESFLVLSPDDRLVLAAAGLGVGIWDLDTGENVQKFESTAKVTCLAVSPDGSHVAAGCENNAIIVWDSQRRTVEKELRGHEGPVMNIAFNQQGQVVSASKDASLRVWDITSGESIAHFQGHTKPVLCLVLTGNGKTVVSGSEDKTIRVWDLASRDCVTLKGHEGLVKCLATMNDGNRVVSGSKDMHIRVWHLTSLKCLMTLKGHFDLIWALTVSKDDQIIVSASKDDMLKVWRSDNGDCLQTLIGHSSWISCVALTTDGKTIISGSNDKNVKLWSAAGNEHAQKLSIASDHVIHHKAQPECVAMTTDGCWGISGAKDALKLWDVKSQTCVKSFPASVSCVTKAHKSALAVTGSHDGTVTIWDCVTGEKKRVLSGHERNVTKVVMTEDDSEIISTGFDGTVRVRSTEGSTEGATLRGHTNVVTCVAVLSDGRHILTGSKDASVKLWDVSSEECQLTFQSHKKDVACLALTSDDKYFVSGSTDFTLKIWHTEKQDSIHTITDYNDSITDVVMTTDNRFAIAGSHESKKQLRMWDIKSAECVKCFEGHTHAIMRLQILRAHDILVSSSRDGTVKIWDIETGAMLNSFDFQSQVKHFDCALENENHYSMIAVTKSGTVGLLKLWNPKDHPSVVKMPESDPIKVKALEPANDDIDGTANESREQLLVDNVHEIQFREYGSSCGRRCCRCCKCALF